MTIYAANVLKANSCHFKANACPEELQNENVLHQFKRQDSISIDNRILKNNFLLKGGYKYLVSIWVGKNNFLN